MWGKWDVGCLKMCQPLGTANIIPGSVAQLAPTGANALGWASNREFPQCVTTAF
jgi:hypothetical protein